MYKYSMEYFQLQTKLEIRDILERRIRSRSDWIVSKGFELLLEKKVIFKDCPLILDLVNNFSGDIMIIRMNPMTWYNWHVDVDSRKSALNYFVSGPDSKTLFSEPIEGNSHTVKIKELKYDLDRFYLFNTQIPHAVLNLDNYRYMLSVGFKNSFEEVLAYCKEHNT